MNDDGRSLYIFYRPKFLCAGKKISQKIISSLSSHPQKDCQASLRPKSLKNMSLNGRQIVSLIAKATSLGLVLT